MCVSLSRCTCICVCVRARVYGISGPVSSPAAEPSYEADVLQTTTTSSSSISADETKYVAKANNAGQQTTLISAFAIPVPHAQ